MAGDESGNGDFSTLNDHFTKGFKEFLEIDKSSVSANDRSYQSKVSDAIKCFEGATHLVNKIGIFSSNEEIEEVATSHLKFLLLPALLGSLTQKNVSGDRSEIVRISEVYFRDFLQRCRQYGVTSYELVEAKEDGAEQAAKAKKSNEQLATQNLLDSCRSEGGYL